MELTKLYKRTLFEEADIRELLNRMEILSEEKLSVYFLIVYRDDHTWNLDNIDDFFEEYNRGFRSISLCIKFGNSFCITCKVSNSDYGFEVGITAVDKTVINNLISLTDSLKDKRSIDRKFDSFNRPPIFIGHGQNPVWKDLKDHLKDKHSYEVNFYESADRSSGYVFDNVAEMVNDSSISILVFSKDDEMKDGEFRARQNVIHELGYSQAIIGRKNTLIVIEKGCEWPSNLQGIDTFRYENSIREIYGDTLAAVEKRFFNIFAGKS